MRTAERWGRWGSGGARGLGALLALLAAGGAGCGGGNASGGTGGESGSGNPGVGSTSGAGGSSSMSDPPGGDLKMPTVSVQGGSAVAASGQGQNGGVVHLLAQGDISFDPTMAPAGGAPSEPSGATAVTSSALA